MHTHIYIYLSTYLSIYTLNGCFILVFSKLFNCIFDVYCDVSSKNCEVLYVKTLKKRDCKYKIVHVVIKHAKYNRRNGVSSKLY